MTHLRFLVKHMAAPTRDVRVYAPTPTATYARGGRIAGGGGRIAGGGGRIAAGGGLFAGGGGLFAGGPFAAGLIAGGPFASGLNAAHRLARPLYQ